MKRIEVLQNKDEVISEGEDILHKDDHLDSESWLKQILPIRQSILKIQ